MEKFSGEVYNSLRNSDLPGSGFILGWDTVTGKESSMVDYGTMVETVVGVCPAVGGLLVSFCLPLSL